MNTAAGKASELGKPVPRRQRLANLASKFGSFGFLFVLVVIASILSPNFLDPTNIFLILRQASVLGIAAIGQTFVIIAGGIDLTLGSVLSISETLVCNLMQYETSRAIPLLFLVIFFGALVGFINGFFITKYKIPPIVMTLGMMTLIQGAGLMYSKGIPLNTLTDEFRIIGLEKIWIIPIPVILWVIMIVIGIIILHYTDLGRYIFAVGGNPEATRLSGVNEKMVKTMAYVAAGIFTAIAGYVLAARLGVGDEWVGASYNLDSIAAVVIGGTSLNGGRGSVINTIAGVLIMSVLYNLLLLLGVSYFWQEVVKGFTIVGGVLLYTYRARRKA